MTLAWVVLLACLVIQYGELEPKQVFPSFVFAFAAYLSFCILLLATLGTVASCGYPERKRSLAIYCVVSTVLLIAFMLGLFYTFIYSAGLDTSSSLFYSWEFIVEMMQHASVEFARAAPGEWVKVQEMFECCGVSMQKTYLYPTYGVVFAEFLDMQLTGELCARGRPDVEALHAQSAVFQDALEQQMISAQGEGFFCYQRMRVLFNYYSNSAGAIVTLLFLIIGTVFVLVAACILWCREPPLRPMRRKSMDFSTVSTRFERTDSASVTAEDP